MDSIGERYACPGGQGVLCSVQELSHEQKRDRFIDHALDNLMLVRLKRDPGFAKYVLERVRESPAVLERVRQTILLIFGETAKIAYSDPDLPGPKGLFEVMERAVKTGESPSKRSCSFLRTLPWSPLIPAIAQTRRGDHSQVVSWCGQRIKR